MGSADQGDDFEQVLLAPAESVGRNCRRQVVRQIEVSHAARQPDTSSRASEFEFVGLWPTLCDSSQSTVPARVFPIDSNSEPDCASASSTSPRGSSLPSVQYLCEALPEELVMAYLRKHDEITNAIGRFLTRITSENSMTDVIQTVRDRGEIEMVPGKSGKASAWRKKVSE
jgi:hypothetical protein